jgi:HK97 gp10 family phage protein
VGFLIAGPPIITLSPNLGTFLAANAAVKRGVEKAGNEILASAKSLVPVLTGALQDSGTFEIDDSGVGHVVFGGGEVDYAAYVEFGTNDTPTFAFLRRGAEAAGYGV